MLIAPSTRSESLFGCRPAERVEFFAALPDRPSVRLFVLEIRRLESGLEDEELELEVTGPITMFG